MQTLLSAILAMLPLLPGVSHAQVKDAAGNALRAGLPVETARDYNGGTIQRGRAARCRIDDAPVEPCVFFPRNGDGSFAIEVAGRAYYAEMAGRNRVAIDYDNGARMVPQGQFSRDRRDRACWVQQRRRICVY